MRTDEQILAELKEAIEGLLVVSESDYALETLRWSGETEITREYLCQISGKPADSAIEEKDLDTFFQNETFRNVTSLLKSSLSGTRVYQVGRISIPVYIVGRSPQGNWLGLSTRLVQT